MIKLKPDGHSRATQKEKKKQVVFVAMHREIYWFTFTLKTKKSLIETVNC